MTTTSPEVNAALAETVATLVTDRVASRIAAADAELWGPEAAAEAAVRLGWPTLHITSRPIVSEVRALRATLLSEGVDRVVLCGMGGSSLAPEVICAAAGVDLVVLDSTNPEQVRSALVDLERTVVVVSSKSGSTVETDSQRRVFVAAFTAAGIDAPTRLVVVTDPGSALERTAREGGYRAVFLADPNVGGRYSALTAFGLVPSGLAGADVGALLDQAAAAAPVLAADDPTNPGLVLGAALACSPGADRFRDKVVLVAPGGADGLPGFGDWAEQLIAESTGKQGRGVLPVAVAPGAPELTTVHSDVLVATVTGEPDRPVSVIGPDVGAQAVGIEVNGSLGAQLLMWEYATAIAGRLLGINPFDQPDVESAKIAARGLLDATPDPIPPRFVDDGVAVTASAGLLDDVTPDLEAAVAALLAGVPADGYLAVMAYVDRTTHPGLAAVRDSLARRLGRPVTFGWGPRFLHSTGQFHKGGPPVGVFLQLVSSTADDHDLAIPDRPFTFGRLIAAQAAGDAAVLADHDRPVLTLTVSDAAGLRVVSNALGVPDPTDPTS